MLLLKYLQDSDDICNVYFCTFVFFFVINLLSVIYMKDVEKLFLDESNYLKDVF